MSTMLYLARHGETEWNLTGRMQGRGDSPLTERGIEQARRLGARLRDIRLDAIYTSTAQRTIHTAELARGERAIPILPDAGLCEISIGPWEGYTREQILAHWGNAIEDFWRAPQRYMPPAGGETFAEVAQRMAVTVERIAAARPGGALLIVSHGAALKTLLARFAGRPLEAIWSPPPMLQASLSIVEFENGAGRILLEADASFLPAPEDSLAFLPAQPQTPPTHRAG